MSVGFGVWLILSFRAFSSVREDRASWNLAESDLEFTPPMDGIVGLADSLELSSDRALNLQPLFWALIAAIGIVFSLGLLAKTDARRELRMAILAAVVVVVAGALGVAFTWLSIDLLIVSLMGPCVLTLLLLGFTRGAAGATLLSAVGLVGLIVASAVIHTELSGPYMFHF